MADMLTLKTGYGDDAVERLPTQFRSKPRLEALVRGLMDGVETLEAGIVSLYAGRMLETATGEALNVLGRVVGEERRGLDDEPFRLRIRSAIITNKSSGTGNEIIRIFALMTPLPVYLREEFPAGFTLRVTEGPLLYPEVYADVLQRAKAGGVRAVFEWLDATPAATFTFDSDYTQGFYEPNPWTEPGTREVVNAPVGITTPAPVLTFADVPLATYSAVRARIEPTTYGAAVITGPTTFVNTLAVTPPSLSQTGTVSLTSVADGVRVRVTIGVETNPSNRTVWRFVYSTDGGASWSAETALFSTSGTSNSTVALGATGLSATWYGSQNYTATDEWGWTVEATVTARNYAASLDDGASWSASTNIPPSGSGPVPGDAGLVLSGWGVDVDYAVGTEWRWPVLAFPAGGGIWAASAYKPR